MDIIQPNLLYLSISKPNVRLSPGRNYGFLGRFNVSINTEDMSTSASAILDLRTVSGNPNLNDIRKMLPKLWLKTQTNDLNCLKRLPNYSRYLTSYLKNPELETAHRKSNFVPETERELLDENRTLAARQFNSLKIKWRQLQPEATHEKLSRFYSYKTPNDASIHQAWEQLYWIAHRLPR